MRKRILSLLIVLALCLGLLPVTALAAGNDRPHSLYVGNTNFASTIYPDNAAYWTSSDGGTNWTSQLEKPTGDSYIHYNGQGTLTLHNANIQGQYDSSNRYSGYGIYAVGAPGDAVSLTIQLEGTNTVSGWSGIFVHAVDGAASLSISGTGSLATEGTGGISFSGIVVQGNGGKAELTINNVDVTATNTSDSAQGILLQSADSSPATLTVNGGELTASGQRAGIKYVFGSSGTGGGTPTVTVSNNAIVRANGGISDDSSTDIQIGADSSASSGGIVFDGKNGTVYGDVTLQEDLKIGEGESLTLDDGASLNAGNHNVIVDGGTLDESIANSLGDSVKYAPTITTHPQNVEVKENETATFAVKVTGTEPLSYQWQQKTSSSDWTDITDETNATYTIATTTMDMNGTQYRCVVKNSINEVTSDAATLTVTAIPTYSITMETDGNGTAFASPASAPEGTTITLTAVPNSGYHFDRWEVISGDITITNNTFTMPAGDVTVKAVFDRDSSGGAHHPDAGSTTTTSSDRYEIETPPDVENGSVKVSPSKAEKGDTVTVTVTPDDGYALDKLAVYDEDGDKLDLNDKGDGKFTFQMPKGDVSIEVSFAPIEDETPKADFSDVPADAWYAEAVQYVYENGLMTGTSDTTFSPDLTTSRSMIATILWRMAGSPVVNYAMDFADVPADQWYAEAVRWASSEGIVGGYGNGSFGTGDPITREQFAVMLYRFAQKQSYDVSVGENTNILSYTDVSTVSEYAIPAMQWAVGSGVITGMGDTLAPQGETTRAQAAMMLMRFSEQYA